MASIDAQGVPRLGMFEEPTLEDGTRTRVVSGRGNRTRLRAEDGTEFDTRTSRRHELEFRYREAKHPELYGWPL